MNLWEIIQVSPEVQDGRPVFKRTNVPVAELIDYLKKGLTVSDFLQDFPSVSQEQASGLLDNLKEYLIETADMQMNEDTLLID